MKIRQNKNVEIVIVCRGKIIKMASDRSDGDRDSNISEEVSSILAVLLLVFLCNMYRDKIHLCIVV